MFDYYYAWTGEVTDGIGFIPSSTPTYAVLGTDANNCYNTAVITIQVITTTGIDEIEALPLIFKRPLLGERFAICASILNILQIFADQLHQMQPEVAPLSYNLLEYSVGVIALILIYFAWKIHKLSDVWFSIL